MSGHRNSVRRSLRSLAAAVCVVSAFIATFAQAQESAGAGKPESVLREFYQWYVQAVAADRNPIANDRAKLKRYVSEAMLRRIDKLTKAGELGSDPFLEAQDLDKGWAKNIKVSNPQIAGAITTADVEMKGPEMGSHKLAVTLRQESGAWKIDKVEPK